MNTAPLATALNSLRREAEERSDTQLLQSYAASNDQGAFAALVKRHGPMVLGVCRRILQDPHDAEDAFQATFLTLARSASSIRKAEALTSWLHGVACRTALRARRDAARRRKHEGRAQPRTDPPSWEVGWRELQTVLDEEVGRLPAGFRAAFVLCALEGLSKTEAAQRLGTNPNTVTSQLARARKRLQERLGRRGISLTAVPAALSVSAAGRAALSPRLVRTAVTTACRLGAGAPVTGLSARAISLAEGVTTTMLTIKTQLALLVLLLCALGTGLGFSSRAPAKPPAAPPSTSPKPDTPKEKPRGTVEVSGRVHTPDGKPVAEAKIYLSTPARRAKGPAVRATSDQDGRFRLTFPAAELDQQYPWFSLLATADGFAPDWVNVDSPGAKVERNLRLTTDVPIQGRILDLNGRPIRGATLRVEEINDYSDVEAFFRTVRDREWPLVNTKTWAAPLPGQPKTLTTGPDGRFTLKGVGRDRVVTFRLEGPGIQYGSIRAIARDLKGPVEPKDKSPFGPIISKVYGGNFVHAPLPSRVIRGVVRDARTGKPVAGARVDSPAFTTHSTRTDREGRYELLGYPKSATGYAIAVTPPPDRPFLIATPVFPDTPGLDPIEGNVELAGGVLVKGRVTNRATGKPLARVQVTYNPLPPNAAAVRLRTVPTPLSSTVTAKDGSYSLAILPGPGVLGFTAANQEAFQPALITPRELKAFFKNEDYRGSENTLYTQGPGGSVSAIGQTAYNCLLLVRPEDKDERLTRDAVLEPARLVKGRVLGPDGKPRARALVYGLSGMSPFSSEKLRDDTFTVRCFDPRRSRHLVFLHPDKLGGILNLTGQPKEPPTVRLAPLGVVTGRLLDEDGEPLVGAPVRLDGARLVDPTFRVWAETLRTDAQGRFRIEGLVPGKLYGVLVQQRSFGRRVFPAFRLKPGEAKNLGETRVKRGE